MKREAVVGCLLGTAVGDALGLPYEGLSRKRAARLFGAPEQHRFVFGHGMISDDTEHTCMVAQSLIEANGEVNLFTKRFARRLRWWMLALPAGVGKATARAGIKLWLGARPEKAGVFSAGNGPAMRAAILGAVIDNTEQLLRFVRASSRLTHTDPKAEFGAITIALAARHARRNQSVEANVWLDEVTEACGDDATELTDLLCKAVESVRADHSTHDFAKEIGLQSGVSGYTYHTVPVAIHAWLSHPNDFRAAVTSMIECGGDADTTAAIVGGIVGSAVGKSGIPDGWISGIAEFPRSVRWIERLGEALADESASSPPTVNLMAVIVRNLLFLAVVLFHGFRRLAPPY